MTSDTAPRVSTLPSQISIIQATRRQRGSVWGTGISDSPPRLLCRETPNRPTRYKR